MWTGKISKFYGNVQICSYVWWNASSEMVLSPVQNLQTPEIAQIYQEKHANKILEMMYLWIGIEIW